jgi:hypothetical protein
MYKEIETALRGDGSDSATGNLIGFYLDATNHRKLAIVEDYAIDRDVFGLEVVVRTKTSQVTSYMGGARSSLYCVEVFLTQHEAGRNTIKLAAERISLLGFKTVTVWNPIGKQGNVKRAVVTIDTNCLC